MKKVQKSKKKVAAFASGLLALSSTACASMRAAEANADARPVNTMLIEEEMTDVSLSTFHVFDREVPLRLAAGDGGGGGHGGGGGGGKGGGGGGGHGCGGGGGHAGGGGGGGGGHGCGGGGCRVGGCGQGCGHGGCGGCAGCRCSGGGCGGCCLVWAGPICIQ